MELSPSHTCLFYLEGDNTEEKDKDMDLKEVVFLDEDRMAKMKEGAPAHRTPGKKTPPKKGTALCCCFQHQERHESHVKDSCPPQICPF